MEIVNHNRINTLQEFDWCIRERISNRMHTLVFIEKDFFNFNNVIIVNSIYHHVDDMMYDMIHFHEYHNE